MDMQASQRIGELETLLREAQDTLNAIRGGDIDAVVMEGAEGHRVYTLETADRPYRMLIERMQEGAATLSRSGDILYCNPHLASLLQLPLEQVTGQALPRFVPPAYRGTVVGLLDANPGERLPVEVALLAHDSGEIPVNLSVVELPSEPGLPGLLCAVITDLTQVKQRARELDQAARRLREETAVREAVELDRERLAMMVEESLDFFGLADLEGRLSYVNAAGRRLVGLGAAAISSNPDMRDCLMPEDQARFTDQVLPATLRDGRWSGDSHLRHFGTGISIPVTQDVFVLTNRNTGEPLNIATIVRDQTEQKQIEEQLRQAQKMEAVGQLTGGIAHDFNNLLTGIMGSLELLQIRLSQGRFDTLERHAKAAAASAARAAAMTQRLLAFSRRQPLTPRSVDADQLVASMEDLLRRTIGPELTLTIRRDAGIWPIRCDANQLENVILNLAINARDAMPQDIHQGGTIEIACVNLDVADPAAARERDIPPGAYVALSVRDTGSGMPPEVKARAFDPFFTTKPLGQGTGLGLSMVYGFVKQSGGHVRLQSIVGEGTTAWLYLPLTQAAAEPNEPPVAGPAVVGAMAGNIVLVVEDEPTIRQLVVEALSEIGLRTMEAVDGPSGLLAVRSPARIDLLVTDVGLPGLNGRQLAEAARSERPDLKVLFMTGYAENPLFGAIAAEARMQMITKPFAIAALQARVRELIRL